MIHMCNKLITVIIDPKNRFEIVVDTSVFDDPYMEAATRAILRLRRRPKSFIHPVIKCYSGESPKQVHYYNSYTILYNAGMSAKAEELRAKYKEKTAKDLADGPHHQIDSCP